MVEPLTSGQEEMLVNASLKLHEDGWAYVVGQSGQTAAKLNRLGLVEYDPSGGFAPNMLPVRRKPRIRLTDDGREVVQGIIKRTGLIISPKKKWRSIDDE
jgi:hypothetical protein